MFVVNANSRLDDHNDYVSTVKYGYAPGFYNFFIGNNGTYSGCSTTTRQTYCCNICDFYFNGYEVPVWSNSHWNGNNGTSDGLSAYGIYIGATTNLDICFTQVGTKIFEGGEVVGKNVYGFYNAGHMRKSCGCYMEAGSFIKIEMGLVHNDGTTDTFFSKCTTTIHEHSPANHSITLPIGDINDGDGLIAEAGDRLYIKSYFCYLSSQATGCNIDIAFGAFQPYQVNRVGGWCSFSQSAYTSVAYQYTPKSECRATPIQISLD